MYELFSFNKINTAVSVGLLLPDISKSEFNYSLSELSFLAKTLNIEVKKTFTQQKNNIQPNYYIGKGKLEEIKKYVEKHQIDSVLFDVELTGIQARNLEKYFDKSIFGRTELILNIFYKRAKTNESKLQVQLASLEYMMPRLRHRWDHFSRVEGGIGMRGGEGEKQLELDRRMIQNQINVLKNKLKKLDIQMKNRRKRRLKKNIISLVGYTNAGKTTLFNLLTKSSKFTENMLFATLDSTIRKMYISHNTNVLLSDTVGFINKLPHGLVASFKSTLDEILVSKLILHVIDASDVNVKNNVKSVEKVLKEIGADQIPCIRIFNKRDLLKNGISDCIIQTEKNDLFISALQISGIDKLKKSIQIFFNLN